MIPAYSVIRVDLAPSDPGASGGIPERLSRGAYQMVSGTIYPQDVLLPRFVRTGIHDTYFIVAATDGKGMAPLIERIRLRLHGEVGLDYSKVEIRIEGRTEPVVAADPGEGLEETLVSVVRRIEELIQKPAIGRN
jgi:hypothetical protein